MNVVRSKHRSRYKDRQGDTLVWDLGVRVFHWVLVVLLVALWATAESEGDWMGVHRWLGTAVLALVVARLIWGFIGSETARFAKFLKGPRAVIGYFREWRRQGDESLRAGHNPAGGWSVVLLLALLLLQAVTGLFSNDDIFFEGPLSSLVSKALSDRLTGIHHLLFNALLAAVALHVLAVIAYWIFKRNNLVLPMILGRKRLPAETAAPQLRSPWWALVILIVVGTLLVWGIGI